jgi:hypothetical protein
MFGAIIGVAAKLIGGAAGAGGAGGILGGGGLLGSLFQGGPLKEIFDLVSNFKTNFLGGASQQPPLGNFGQRDDFAAPTNDRRSRAQERLIDRIEGLLNRLERMRGGEANDEGGCQCSSSNGIDRIRELLRQLVGSGNDSSQASFQFMRSQFLNIQV